MAGISVVLVEDDPRILEGVSVQLAMSPCIQLVGCYTRGNEALQAILTQCPEVALIDLGLPDVSGVELIKRLFEQGCPTECLVLTVYDDDDHLFAALKAGAAGYIVKSGPSLAALAQAIQEVRDGEAPMSVGIARRILREFREPLRRREQPAVQGLTNRELEVLEYHAQGFPTRRVAAAMHISYATVRCHLKSIYRKLQVNSLVEALAAFHGEKRGSPYR